jgi:hypothetical protein
MGQRQSKRAVILGISVLLAAIGAAEAWACDVTLKPDGNTAAIQHAMNRQGKKTTVVCLQPGVYRGARLIASKNTVLRSTGKDKVVFDAGQQGRVLTMVQDGIDVTLQGVTLTNGKAERGGAIEITQKSTLTLRDCWLYNNTSTLHGGGAMAASAGTIKMVRTRITGNTASYAAAIDLSGTAKLKLVSSLIAENDSKGTADPPVRMTGASQLSIVASTIAYNSGSALALVANGPGRRKVEVDSSILMGKPDAIAVQRAEAEDVAVLRSVLFGGIGFVSLDMASKKALPGFNLRDVERDRPEKGSPAIAMGKCSDADARSDLNGKPRGTVCTAGALEAPAADIKATLAERKAAQKKKPTGWEEL